MKNITLQFNKEAAVEKQCCIPRRRNKTKSDTRLNRSVDLSRDDLEQVYRTFRSIPEEW